MENRLITVNVMIDSKIFRKFSGFNSFYLQRRWFLPAVFAFVMSAFACVCFIARGSGAQGIVLGCVLLLIGLGLPAVYLRSFSNYVKSQIKVHRLEKPRLAYSLQFSGDPDGIRVTNPGGEFAQYEWNRLYGIYRVDGCVYLYVTNNKAFLLPDAQIEEGVYALWSLFADMIPAEKLHDFRKGKNRLWRSA
ncbi:MAG: YcxB family protein [Oscillospiraceae bacterium]|jgi:hypothetical protein|nr:YcxB family protein [Oscillospiraceae bacterium]